MSNARVTPVPRQFSVARRNIDVSGDAGQAPTSAVHTGRWLLFGPAVAGSTGRSTRTRGGDADCSLLLISHLFPTEGECWGDLGRPNTSKTGQVPDTTRLGTRFGTKGSQAS